MTDDTIRIASFDMGKKNFAWYIEDTYKEDLEELKERYESLPKVLQRRVKGNMNPEIKEMLDIVCYTGDIVDMGVFDLRSKECIEAKSKGVDMDTRKNIISHLEEYKEIFSTCDIFLVEQQFSSTFTPRGRKNPSTQSNIDAIKIGELVMGWLIANFKDKEIIHYGSQFKTAILGASPTLTKPQRKKWSVEKFVEILNSRDDGESLEKLLKDKKNKQKGDDIADCCIQCQSYKFRTFVACF